MTQDGHAKSVPEMTLRRLPLYHRHLKTLRDAGRSVVSCPLIGADLGLDPTQVRKDLETTGVVGRPKIGFQLDELITAIERFLGWDNANEAFLAGAGHLGTALLRYDRFEACGLSIVAAFDTDPAKVGATLGGKPILHMDKMTDLCARMHVHIGIITVPAAFAQSVADRMIAGGILAIWNFAPIRLKLPPHIIVHNEDLYCSLASLSQKLAALLRPAPPSAAAAEPPLATRVAPPLPSAAPGVPATASTATRQEGDV